ncbi:hypothetical protein DdX_21727 [Ditylenchus destructor]|uniref:Uncharacterized protein n=1 Tax=Ditylenchus destructor TaxID=166010 RepID=A0AAD4QR89_9BILA|nr:hypothetical protein DdX_21727 [Ditylenchus destructor]
MAGVAEGQPVAADAPRRSPLSTAPALRRGARVHHPGRARLPRRYAPVSEGRDRREGADRPTADHTYFMANQPLMRTALAADLLDAHVYWQHPAIYGRRNEPMVNAPELSIIQKLARSAAVGKPFTVSEVNHPFPSDYGAEMIPILASYAALQDWDGIFFYTFETKIAANGNR